jgi:hypothetical protein
MQWQWSGIRWRRQRRDAESAGEAIKEARAQRKGPKYRRSNSQASTPLATRADGREEPEHDGESPGEVRAWRGGPKHRKSTSQDAKETISHAHWSVGHPQNRRLRLGPKQAGKASGGGRVRKS